ncbi:MULTISPECIES: hypothetical protein [Pimelobacter]|uniref:hypothetical protein n=1 Tax=Pimelobacter TaxID=2044 RepID=UPI001C049C5F|nr:MULTISPECIES: hypothetical protein [Pimelobacter]MBU2698844.1 hypothetical protein [Pimelobacter sp. 30-1]UUW93034.1 hypothetical protein M0M43_30540 [Pimelobacter simplex]UUW99066.1 hypothetical protein M0M48_30560 [Pimelobacter simplex]
MFHLHPPPRLTWRNAVQTVVGVLTTALTLALVLSGLAVANAPAAGAATATVNAAAKTAAKTVKAASKAVGPVARAAAPKSACRPYDPNLRNGVCVRFADGRVTWLGNLTNPKGRIFFCIDKGKDSRLPASAPIKSTKDLKSQYGKAIRKQERAALNYVILEYATGAGDTDAAAIHYLIRLVMSDTKGQLPGNLRVGDEVPGQGAVPDAVIKRARVMWNKASAYYGPWTLQLTGSTADIKVGQTRTLQASVVSAAGKRVPGAKITLAYNDRVSGPTTVTSLGDRNVPVTITARKAGTLAINGSIVGPAGEGKLFDPPNNGIQRGWIAQKESDTAQLRLSGEVRFGEPVVFTVTSSKLVEPGEEFFDNVHIENLPAGVTTTATARLYGRYEAQPTATDCQPAQLAKTVTFPVNGSGDYKTPKVSVSEEGYYTWVITLAATADTIAVTTPCGIVQETTLVSHPLLAVTASTQISAQRSRAGDKIYDTIKLSVPEHDEPLTQDLKGEWTVFGPVAPINGSCEGVSYANAGVLATAPFTVAAGDIVDGHELKTPEVLVPAAGCFSYGEEIFANDEIAPYSHPVGQVSQTTLADKNKPTIATQVSAQKILVGGTTFDTIMVSGLLPGQTVEIMYTKYGPVDAVNGKCDLPASAWVDAPVFDEGSVIATGNGPITTPVSKPVQARGCYSYGERLIGNDVVENVEHPVGHVTQTTLADKAAPAVKTLVSRQIAFTGGRLHDTVWVTGLLPGVQVRVYWTLYGPMKPVNGSCKAVNWDRPKARAKVVDKGSFIASKNGKYKTRVSKKLKKAGCYTYGESVNESTTNYPHEHKPGKKSQTSLVKKPRRPDIPTGPAGFGRSVVAKTVGAYHPF